MAIERFVEIRVTCDHYGGGLGTRCNETRDELFTTIDEATFWLRDEGWTVGKKVLCPEHARRTVADV